MKTREEVAELGLRFSRNWDQVRIQRFAEITGMPFDLRFAAYRELLASGYISPNDARILEGLPA